MRGTRHAHPDLYDRMEQAGLTPEYPRPDPPSLSRARVGIGILILGFLIFFGSLLSIKRELQAQAVASALANQPSAQVLAQVSLIFGSQDCVDYALLGYFELEAQRPDRAYQLLSHCGQPQSADRVVDAAASELYHRGYGKLARVLRASARKEGMIKSSEDD